jgi:Helicase conserved C-terminal domain
MDKKPLVTQIATSEIEAELARRQSIAQKSLWPLLATTASSIRIISKAKDFLGQRLSVEVDPLPIQSFSFPILPWDSWVVLSRLAREPLKLNIDQSIPVRWFKGIENRLSFIPDWIGLDADIQTRLHTSLSLLRTLEFVQRRSNRAQDLEFLITATGTQALQDGPAAFFLACLHSRMPRILDPGVDHLPDACGNHISQLQWTVRIDAPSLRGLGQILSKRVLACLPCGRVVHRARMLQAFQGSDPFVRKMGGGWEGRSVNVSLEDFFERIPEIDSPMMLGEALTYPVLLGLLESGFDSAGKATSALSHSGAALLGTTAHLARPAPQHIHLTPAYDIVFGRPDAQAKAWIAVFADLTGQEHGVVAKLTSTSIQSAIAYGIDAGQILSFLDSVLAQPLPANVRTTMEDWARKARPVALTNGTLLTCTDEVTASTLTRLAGTKIQRLGPTQLFLSDRKFLPSLRKKAEALGILL